MKLIKKNWRDQTWVNVAIRPSQVRIVNELYNSEKEQYIDGVYLTLQNVTVKSPTMINFNGYKSVTILPGFIAEQGSNVRICNDINDAIDRTKNNSVYNTRGGNTESRENSDEKSILYQNVPNPVRNITTIRYEVSRKTEHASIIIYNLSGSVMKEIFIAAIGQNEIRFDASDLPDGIYVYSLFKNNQLVDTKRMTIAH